MGENSVAMDLINSVTGVDEEGRARQRILTFAAKRYASAIERNCEDYDALYNWALVLQESADNVGPDSSSPSKDALLEEACKKYDEAIRLCPTLNDAFYNWAIAISDRAKLRGRTKEAEELWKQATKNYEKAVQLNWNSPQAHNNWGLALQELSAIVPVREKQTIVKTAIRQFRAAIQLQFDFHRAIYNLGTVLYGLAEDTLRSGRPVNEKDTSPNELYSQSAIYIAAAHALKPNYSVYRSALRLVRSMLPLPYLKVGHFTAPPAGNPIAPHSDWRRSQFVLNHEGLLQVSKVEQKQPPQNPSRSMLGAKNVDKALIKVNTLDIISVSACADLTLPPGAGLCIDTIHGPIYLVADSWEALNSWLDAIRLVYTIFARGKSDVLAGILNVIQWTRHSLLVLLQRLSSPPLSFGGPRSRAGGSGGFGAGSRGGVGSGSGSGSSGGGGVRIGLGEDEQLLFGGSSSPKIPVNVPVWPRVNKDGKRIKSRFDEVEDDMNEEMLPPHEIVARTHTERFSVFEGVGRTLKGRDLREVRNAIWQKTGFLD